LNLPETTISSISIGLKSEESFFQTTLGKFCDPYFGDFLQISAKKIGVLLENQCVGFKWTHSHYPMLNLEEWQQCYKR
jgi:hypothetical protein